MKVIQFTIPVSRDHTIIVQEDLLPFFYNHLHRHNEIQVTLVLKGKGTLITGNFMQAFKPGDIYIIGANQPHIFKNDPAYFTRKVKGAVHAVTMFFDPVGSLVNILRLPEAKAISRFLNETKFGFRVSERSSTAIKAGILDLHAARSGYKLAKFIALLQLFSDDRSLKKLSSITYDNSYSEQEGIRMNDVYQYTLNNYTENISLNKIASVACMTPQAFCRYFKKHTQKTYVGFLNEVRINEACKIISSAGYSSILSVAYETGFSSAVSFNRVFKRIMSLSPSQYRHLSSNAQ